MRRVGGTLLALLLAGGSVSAFPWIRDMWVGPVILPQLRPMTPPENVLAIDGQQAMNRIDSRDKLHNPLPASRTILAQGAELYGIYCAPCHGVDALGDGAVAEHFRRMPDLTAANVQGYADGWLYSIVREGGFNMPPFAASLSVNERWAVVHHLRTLNPNPEPEE
jgi:mono/diheme cytochrome c family protein